MKIIYGNLFDHLNKEPNVLDIVVHGCNAQGVMGSGFAKELRERYPEAFSTYREKYEKSGLDLGSVVYYIHKDQEEEKTIVIANAITQEFFGRDGKRYVDYDAIAKTFEHICSTASSIGSDNFNLHFPAIGSGLGGGDEEVINNIIEEKIKKYNVNATLYLIK